MYSVALVLALTTSMETDGCHRRNRCCAPPCCAPVCAPCAPCCGTATAPPPVVGGDKKMVGADKKKEQIAPPMTIALSKDEEIQMKELRAKFMKEKVFNDSELKQWEKWYKEQTHEGRAAEYKSQMQKKDGGKDGNKGDVKKGSIEAPAQILVQLPANATLTIDGQATMATSASRLFQTPALNKTGFYAIQAIVEHDGLRVAVNRMVRVEPGQTTSVRIEIPTTLQIQSSRN